MKSPVFEDYKKIFIQRYPRYAVKSARSGTWKTRNKPLSDPAIKAHLEGKYSVAGLGPWYPPFIILDIDNREYEEVEKIRSRLELTDSNSMILESESENSYHILLKGEYHKKPPTLKLLKEVTLNFARSNGIEIYPQANRPIRLPFGKHQDPIDPIYAGLDWQQLLYWYNKFDPLDLSFIPSHQMVFNFEPIFKLNPENIRLPADLQKGPVKTRLRAEELFEEGLQGPSSRNESQFYVLHLLWRRNLPKENAIKIVWNWINKKHNGYSKDIWSHPGRVYKEIERQADYVWRTFEIDQVYPDSTHNLFHGYITKADIPDIVNATGGSLPRMKFLFNLVKYSYPRRYRKFISIHRDKLVKWSSHRTYQKYLNEFEAGGIAERKKSYLPGVFSKDLKIDWPFRSDQEAVLYSGRAVDTFEGTVKRLFKPDDFRQMIEKVRNSRQAGHDIIKSLWGKNNREAEK